MVRWKIKIKQSDYKVHESGLMFHLKKSIMKRLFKIVFFLTILTCNR